MTPHPTPILMPTYALPSKTAAPPCPNNPSSSTSPSSSHTTTGSYSPSRSTPCSYSPFSSASSHPASNPKPNHSYFSCSPPYSSPPTRSASTISGTAFPNKSSCSRTRPYTLPPSNPPPSPSPFLPEPFSSPLKHTKRLGFKSESTIRSAGYNAINYPQFSLVNTVPLHERDGMKRQPRKLARRSNVMLWWISILAIAISSSTYIMMGRQAEIDIAAQQTRLVFLLVAIIIVGLCVIFGISRDRSSKN